MSKKVLKLAGQRPMLLAIIMATLTLGLLFSGWLTPTSLRAQTGSANPQANSENGNCVVSSVTTNCSDGSVVLSNLVVNPAVGCIGSAMSASVSKIVTAGQIIVDTSYTNDNPNATNSCNDTYTTNTPSPTIVSNWWSVSGPGDFAASGSGLSASFTPTNCGGGSITFNTKWKHVCDTNTDTTSMGGSFTVVAVDSLGPISFSAQAYNDPNGDPNTTVYVTPCTCSSSIMLVQASSCPGMDDASLPPCWNMSGGLDYVNPDGKTSRTIRGVNTGLPGTTVITATCGSSTKTAKVIVYLAVVTLNSDEEGRNLANCGHAWINLSIIPASINNLLTAMNPDGTITDYSQYLGDWGFMPTRSDWRAAACPGRLDHDSGGHKATGSYSWGISASSCLVGLIDIKAIKDSPGWYIFWGSACCSVAEAIEDACIGVTPCSNQTPWYLSDCLKTLVPPICLCIGN